METIRCRKCGTEYHTTTDNLNQGKYLKCLVCARIVYLKHDNSVKIAQALTRFRRGALSLLGLSGKKAF